MIRNENKNFLAEALEDSDRDNAVRKASTEQWWADFEYADTCGWTFKTSKKAGGGRVFTAYRDQSLGWFDSLSDALINVMLAISAEDYAYPERDKLRDAGWRCATTHYGASYMSKGDVVRPLFPSIEAAWADLVRSIP
ncbi:hypothetical protein [Pseudomonas sp.]|uniref:hypothetical protein n=1 Tax=Pseudomonas sp. TaxID=306 RepID=UPI003FD870FB